jgi:uncharacterized membrane protein
MSRVGIAAAFASLLCIFMLFASLTLLLSPTAMATGSLVHGNVYDWATFDTMNNAVVEVYSMPGQMFVERTVTKSGSYSFDLPAGTYLISARAGIEGTPSELLAIENITISDSGDYTIDLILFPPTGLEDLEAMNESELNSSATQQTTSPSPTPQPGKPYDLAFIGIGVIVVAAVLVLASLFYLRWSGRKKNAPPEAVPPVTAEPPGAKATTIETPVEQEASEKPVEAPARPTQYPAIHDPLLPPDCRDVLTIMEKNGGRITQLELRKLLPYSEAKVSLIVSDLESRGIIKKIKKGRGNILIINKPGEQQPPEK